jgi:hypothetical protein
LKATYPPNLAESADKWNPGKQGALAIPLSSLAVWFNILPLAGKHTPKTGNIEVKIEPF